MENNNTSPLSLSSTLNEMRIKNDFCDSTIKTDDGGYFNVHKVVLVANSSYFRALYNNLNSGHREEVVIPGVSSEMMKQIIEYAYLRKANVHWHNVWDLLVASDQFNVSGLVSRCNDFLIKHMVPLNCIRIWKFARDFFIRRLEFQAYRYLMANIHLIPPDSREFVNLTVEEVYEIFSDCKLNLSEENVWLMLLPWIENYVETTPETVQRLLSCVRTCFISKDFLFREIINNDLVALDESCRSQVLEKYRILTQLPLITEMDIVCPPVASPRIPHEILFLIGGCIDDMASNAIQAYDCKADMWTQVQLENAFIRRAYHKCLAIGHEIFIIGGRDENNCITACYCFSVLEKSWREIAPLLIARSSLCAAVLDGEIYAIAGSDGEAIFSSTEVYNPSENEWRPSESLQTKRVRAAAATLDNSIFVAGGYTGQRYLKSVEVYDADSNTWMICTPMRHKRSELALTSWNGFLYAAGGYCGDTILSTVERYDPSTDSWVLISEMRSPRCQFSMAVMNEALVIIGGLIDDDTETCTVERYDHTANKWDPLGDNDDYLLAAAECIVKDLDEVSEYVLMDRSRVLIEKREQLIAFKEREDGSFIRALSMYNM